MPVDQANEAARPWTRGSSFLLFALAVLAPASAYFASLNGSARWAWLAAMFFIASVMVFVGTRTTGEFFGVLIDDRNVMSLSRFQMVAWTLVVLSGFLTAGMWNLSIGYVEPLSISLPSELWMLMGISTASLVASPLLLNSKKTIDASDSEAKRTFTLLQQAGDTLGAVGTNGALVVNREASSARFSDMLTGEETGNAAHADLARIQMFFFTLIVLSTYALALWQMFGALDDQGVEAFPVLDESVLALIGISHAGYLAAKATPHSKPADQ